MLLFWPRASNDFGASHYGIQTIKMGFNQLLMFVTFQYRGLHHLDMYCTLITEVWHKSNIHFDGRYLELWNAYIMNLIVIVFNVRDGIKSKYPSIVFLSIRAVSNKSDCRSRGREFYPGSRSLIMKLFIPPFSSPPMLQEGLLSVTCKSMYTKYVLTAESRLPRKFCGK